MSRFFEALEQAEQERARQEKADLLQPDTYTAVPVTAGEKPHVSPPVEQPGEPGRKRHRAHTRPLAETPDGVEPHLVSLLDPETMEADQYRTLRYLVEQKRRETGLCMIAVSSPIAGDGKTITSINLAGALAQGAEARVLLVDMDLRHPSLTENLGLGHSSSRGLTDAILNPTLSLKDVVKRCPQFNLTVISSGRPPSPPYEVLKSPHLEKIWQDARQHYDYIVLDTPPLIPFPDCRLIGKWADGFLVVVAAHKTPQKLVEEAINVVDPAKMVGLVFNNSDRPGFGYNYYYSRNQSANGNGKGWLSRAAKS